jgi:hypothetical protein
MLGLTVAFYSPLAEEAHSTVVATTVTEQKTESAPLTIAEIKRLEAETPAPSETVPNS